MFIAPPAFAQDAKLDTAKIEQLTGAKGKMSEKEGVFKVSLPRDDLHDAVGGVKLTPAMGLTCWASFQPMGDHVMVMGDQVLTEDQVSPVMDAALQNGLSEGGISEPTTSSSRPRNDALGSVHQTYRCTRPKKSSRQKN